MEKQEKRRSESSGLIAGFIVDAGCEETAQVVFPLVAAECAGSTRVFPLVAAGCEETAQGVFL